MYQTGGLRHSQETLRVAIQARWGVELTEPFPRLGERLARVGLDQELDAIEAFEPLQRRRRGPEEAEPGQTGDRRPSNSGRRLRFGKLLRRPEREQEVGEGRVGEGPPEPKLPFRETGVVLCHGRRDRLVFRTRRLDRDDPGPFPSSHTAGRLRHELKRPLGGSEVRKREAVSYTHLTLATSDLV